MKMDDLRDRFTIFVFLPEIDLTADLKQLFATSGYETFMLIDQEMLLDRVKEAAPHVILFSPEALTLQLSQFVEKILQINSEIQFVCLAKTTDTAALWNYREFGVSQVINPGEDLPRRALWALDNVCEKLALTYQNEELLANYEAGQASLEEKSKEILQLQEAAKNQSTSIDVKSLILRFQNNGSKEELISNYFNLISEKVTAGNCHCIFFKYLPTVISFVATQGFQVDLERTKGIGSKLTTEEMNNLFINNRLLPASLEALMRENFNADGFFCFPLILKNKVEGVFIFWEISEAELGVSAWEEFLLFQTCYQNAHYQKRAELLEIHDPVTDLYNQNFYFKKLEEETSRAKRLTKALSLVKISIDQYSELEDKLTPMDRELILRSIALLIKKTSRINDFGCRTGEHEISLILPHSGKKGSALRAERLRRAVENHSFALNGVHITISAGVAEYPTLSRSAEDLDRSASQALEFITAKGGNKVCLYTPQEQFEPDFEVSAEGLT